jgi:molybdopterin-binding protein
MTTGSSLGLGEHLCLALVAEGISHGWAVGAVVAPDGELGRIWSLSRPLTYRAIEQLVERKLVTRTGTAAGRGRDRRTVAVTAAGRKANRRWLDEPVEHLRDVRTELLLKLELRRRAGLPLEPLLDAQRDALRPIVDALVEARDPDLVARWRREHARAVRRFLTSAAEHAGDSSGDVPPTSGLRLSARNQLRATISRLELGDALCTVTALLPDGQPMTATITRGAVDDLDLTEGDQVLMVSKATETMVARPA